MRSDKKTEAVLWEKYKKCRTIENRNQLVIFYNDLVKLAISKLVQSYNQYLDYEDLVSSGVFGLIDAIEKFDFNKGVKFETYASIRIRGALIDYLRKQDWLPTGLRRKIKKIETAYNDLGISLGRTPTEQEVAEHLCISIAELKSILEISYTSNIINFDDAIYDSLFGNRRSSLSYEPEYYLEEKLTREMLVEAIDSLTEREKIVVSLYYNEELTLKEIGKVLNITESRVSQIHSKILIKLRNKMNNMIKV